MGVSDEEAALLDAIDADPGDQARLVYADWLQQHGHPRGELIGLHVALRDELDWSARRELYTRERQLFRDHREQLLPTWLNDGARVTWSLGFIHHVTLLPSGPVTHGGDLAALLLHPSARFLRSVNVSRIGLTPDDVRQVAEGLGRDLATREGLDDPVLPHEMLEGRVVVVGPPENRHLFAQLELLQGQLLPRADEHDWCVRARLPGGVEWWHASDEPVPLSDDPPRTEPYLQAHGGTPDPSRLEPDLAFALDLPVEVDLAVRIGLHHGRLRRELRFSGRVHVHEEAGIVLSQQPLGGLPFEPWTPVEGLVIRR